MKSTQRGASEWSRREFFALGALFGTGILAARLPHTAFAAADAPGPGKFQLVPDWPLPGRPDVMCRGIDADRRGRIYIAGDAQHPVMRLSPAGKYLGAWGQDVLATPHGVRVHDDTVWVTDVETHMAHQFTLDGKLLRSFGEQGVAGDGPNQFNKPTDFAFAPDGAVYISDGYKNTRVVCREPDGSVRTIWGEKGTGPGQFDLVHAIAIDPKGRVYVADRNNARVQIFDLKGNYITEWKHVGKPYGLYACDDGTLFCCGLDPEDEQFRVRQLSGDGKVLAEFGATGEARGQFLMAHSIYVDQAGAVFVADGAANRVQKFARS